MAVLPEPVIVTAEVSEHESVYAFRISYQKEGLDIMVTENTRAECIDAFLEEYFEQTGHYYEV